MTRYRCFCFQKLEVGGGDGKKKVFKLAFIHNCTFPILTLKPVGVDFPVILYFPVIFQTTPVSWMQV